MSITHAIGVALIAAPLLFVLWLAIDSAGWRDALIALVLVISLIASMFAGGYLLAS